MREVRLDSGDVIRVYDLDNNAELVQTISIPALYFIDEIRLFANEK